MSLEQQKFIPESETLEKPTETAASDEHLEAASPVAEQGEVTNPPFSVGQEVRLNGSDEARTVRNIQTHNGITYLYTTDEKRDKLGLPELGIPIERYTAVTTEKEIQPAAPPEISQEAPVPVRESVPTSEPLPVAEPVPVREPDLSPFVRPENGAEQTETQIQTETQTTETPIPRVEGVRPVTPESTDPSEPVENGPLPPTSVLDAKRDFDSDKKSVLEKFEGWARQKFGDMAASARSNTWDLLNANVQQQFFDYHDGKSVKVATERDQVTSQRKSLEDQLKAADARLAVLQNTLPEHMVGVEHKVAQEKAGIAKKIEKLSNQERTLNARLELLNTSKLEYQGKRNAIATEVTQRMRERLEPHVHRLELAKDRREQLDTEVKHFTETVNKIQASYDAYKRQYDTAAFKFEREPIKAKLEELKFLLKDSQKHLNKRMAERARADAALGKAEKPVRRLHHINEKFAEISKRQGHYAEVPRIHLSKANTELPDLPRGSSSGGSNADDSEGYEPFGSMGRNGTAERAREVLKSKPMDFVSLWNSGFASRERIDKQPFQQFLKTRKMNPDDTMAVQSFISLARSYFSAMREEGVTKRAEKKLDKDLQSFAERADKRI